MTKLKNLLRCYASGMGIRSISSTFHISRNTLRKYVRKFQESGLSMEQILSLSDDKLADLFSDGHSRNRPPSARKLELEALVPDYVKRLSKKGVSILSLHTEYLKTHPNGYQYSTFKHAIHAYRCQTRAVGHVEHLAGDQMYIDYAGDKLEIVEEQTGEVRKVEVFVATLPCSHYTYCEAVWSQKKEDLIIACENALHFFGGVPKAVVPDNLKSAVIRSDRNEPVINDDFAAMAEFYDMAVYPARVRRPKDKALVENAVKLMYRSVYVDIEGQIFHNGKVRYAAYGLSYKKDYHELHATDPRITIPHSRPVLPPHHHRMTPHHDTVCRNLLQDKSNGGTLWQQLGICSKPYCKRYGGIRT